jgi:16S rRNA (cytosine1402-N4)-methyltransferase
VIFVHGNFGELGKALDQAGWRALDAALFDLGVSSLQLDKAQRGFSFSREGPLDMRMDPDQETTAAHLVNHLSPLELEELIREYGEERWAGRIAKVITRSRPFSSTSHLAEAIRSAVPASARHGRIDPATRAFQAVRMAVNREQEELSSGLPQAIERLRPGGRIAVLSYHSLEDRIVKNCFRTLARAGALKLITKKPLRPSEEEVAENPRSRSARLRVAEKT